MANDSQRDKARAIFGKTFFANTKEPAPAKNAAAALQKRANARPIPTYKVGGVVKKNNGGAMSGRNTPEADDVLITTPRGKRILEEQRKREAEKAKAEAAKRARADKLLGIPAQKGGGKAGCYADGGMAMAGAKRAVKAERDFTGLMKKAADRAAAKGTPVMKDGGPTDEYTAKRVMSRIKAGNFAEGGEAKDRMEARMRKAEKSYKVALAKGKNEGIAKAKFERKKADIADDYAKKTGADRTATKAAEQAAKAALREARQTKGASIAKREFDESMAKKGSQSVAPKTVDVGATLKGLSAMPSAETPKAAPAKAKARVSRPAAPVTRRTTQQDNTPPAGSSNTPPAGSGRSGTSNKFDAAYLNTKMGAPNAYGNKANLQSAKAAADAAKAKSERRSAISEFFLGSDEQRARYANQQKSFAAAIGAKDAAEKAKRDAEAKAKFRQATQGQGLMAPVKRAVGGTGKVRKGMMKGK